MSKVHLEELINSTSKDQHNLSMSDLSEQDKMKFRPVQKITAPQVIKGLQDHVADSAGTSQFLEVCASAMSSYMDADVLPLARISKIW